MTRGFNGARRELMRFGVASHQHSTASMPPVTIRSPFKLCTSCQRAIRHASSAAATASEEPTPVPIAQRNPPVTTSTAPHQAYNIRAGVVLSRPPLITRDLHPFEKAFFLYQRRLNERTALPFTRFFYYAKDSPGDVDWKRKIPQRHAAARDIGVYNAYRLNPWNDELLVGAQESEPENQIEALVTDAITAAEAGKDTSEQAELEGLANKKKQATIERPMPRVTEADKNGDVRSLNRALARTLYLVVNGEQGWQLPAGSLDVGESLHRAAERLMVQAGGVNMNTWIVGNAPVGHYVHKYGKAVTGEDSIERLGEKTFYMKARILAGKADLKNNALGLKDYKWLSKEELEKELVPEYYWSIRNMLVQI